MYIQTDTTVTALNMQQFINTVNGLGVEVYFSAAEREAYQKSTHCLNVTNYSLITRHFMMQGNILQSIGYQAVR
jgi:hypothetical protein